MRQKWQGVAKDKVKIIPLAKTVAKKIDKNANKLTFIDVIFRDNNKKNFPKPGPSDHFMDPKTAQKFYK